jgi:GSH-dependent disulfide-bond oxidoreductase
MPKARSKTRARPAPARSRPSVKPWKITTKCAATKPAVARKSRSSKGQRPIELYFWPTSNGLKISIMLEECGLPYDLKPININRGEQFAPHFLAVSPNNRIPAILDPDGPGGKPIAIFESGAILQYLGRKTGKFYPKDERGRTEVDQWLFWQVGGLGPMAGQAHHFRGDAPEQIPYAIGRIPMRSTGFTGSWISGSRPAIISPALIRSPTWLPGDGRAIGSGKARQSTIFPISKPGSNG